MTARREASQPPAIPGYDHVSLLGMGGFADVFLYRQRMPSRPVAVKVLLSASLDDEARSRFRTEADIMASLSHHPSIVTVYQADVAGDGRPYLVMEYCSRAGLAQRYRTERMGVAEVLRIGIRLASAVETAHRAGVLHRDIKPANVLVTDFGWPALTDFGIAATAAGGAMVGMSIPWSPPEMLTESPVGDVRSDVYSLAATVFSLLAGRSPFEVPDGPNSAADLITRIERIPLPGTGRGDVPESLHGVLDRAMAKDPDRRYHSAVAFARALQQVEAELMLPLTPLDLPEDAEIPAPLVLGGEPGSEAEQETRLRPVRTVSIEAERQLAAAHPGAEAGSAARTAFGTGLDHLEDDVPEAWRRHVAELEAARAVPETPRRRIGRVVAAGVAGAAVVTALVVAAVATLERPGPRESSVPTGTATLVAPEPAPAAPVDLAGTAEADGSVTFTWANPEPREGDRYLWGAYDPAGSGRMTPVDTPPVTVQPDPSGKTCVQVTVVRADGRMSDPAVGCVP